MSKSASYPDDIESLKRLLASREEMIAKLMAEIARLKRWQFGRSSERMEGMLAQLQLTLDDLEFHPQPSASPASEPVVAEEESAATAVPSNVVPLRRAPRGLPAHLPRETVVHSPAECNCPDCGSALRKLGEDIAETGAVQ